MQRSQEVDVRAMMMRGWTPLFVVAVAMAIAPRAWAQEGESDEPMPSCCTATPPTTTSPTTSPPTTTATTPETTLPTVPPPLVAPSPVIVCCADPLATPLRKLFFTLAVGPSYRRAFGSDFIAAVPELEVGGQTRAYSIATRFSAAFGATRVGLPFQFFNVGPSFMFHISPRWKLGFAANMGFMMYERATTMPSDPVVWSPAFGAALDVTADVLRTRSGGALFVGARVATDWVLTLHGGFDDGLTIAPSVALGWRL